MMTHQNSPQPHGQVTSPSEELRAESRLASRLDVFLSVPGDGAGEQILITRCLDVSANGLRVLVDHTLTPGTILQAGVRHRSPGFDNPLILIAEVMWAQESHGEALLGLRLFESEDSHIGQWKQAVASWLMPPDDV